MDVENGSLGVVLAHFENISSQNLKELHKSIYSTKSTLNHNFNIIISGDFSDNITCLIEKSFSKIPWSNVGITNRNINSINRPSNFYINQKNALQTAFRIGRLLPGNAHADFFGLKILITLLGGYFGSRLMTNIREEKGYTYGIGSFVIAGRFCSELHIVTEVGSSYTKQVLKEIIKEMDSLINQKVSVTELNKVKSYLLGSILHNCNGVFNQSAVFRDLNKHNNSFEFIENFISVINTINVERIQFLAQKYLRIKDISFVACGPPEQKLW